MDFRLSEEQEMLRQTVRDFANDVLKPRAAQIDESGEFPFDTVKKAAELGLMGVAIPEEWGGAGMDYLSYAIAIEEVSKVCATTGVILSVNNSLVCDPLKKFANDEQKDVSKLPLLGHIPIIGELFKSRSFQERKTELAVFVTPKVVSPNTPRIRQLIDDIKARYRKAKGEVGFGIFD